MTRCSHSRQPAWSRSSPSLLIVLALVYYLVSVIVQLRKITTGLDEVIADVGEIVEKSAPVNDVVTAINEQLDAGVDLLEGLLVKKAGLTDAVGLVDGLYPGAAAAGLQELPGEHRRSRRRASARSTREARSRSRGSAARRRSPPASPDGPAAQRRGRQPRGAAAVPGDPPDAARDAAQVAGDRHRRARAVRAARRHRGAAQAAPRPAAGSLS